MSVGNIIEVTTTFNTENKFDSLRQSYCPQKRLSVASEHNNKVLLSDDLSDLSSSSVHASLIQTSQHSNIAAFPQYQKQVEIHLPLSLNLFFSLLFQF